MYLPENSKIDYTKYITEEYAQKTVMDLFKDVIPAISNASKDGTLTLQYLANISPMIDTWVDNLIKELDKSFGMPVDKEELMALALSGNTLPQFIESCIKDIDFSYEDTDSLLMHIAYGTLDVDYELVDGKPEMLNGNKATTVGDLVQFDTILNKITVEAMNSNFKEQAKTSAMIRTFIWGPEGKTHTYNETTQTPEWLPMVYTKMGDTEFEDVLGYTYAYNGERYINEKKDWSIVAYAPASPLAASTTDSQTPAFVVINQNDEPVYELYQDGETKDYVAYKHGTTEKALCSPLTVQDLMNGDIENMFMDLPLSAVLGDEAYSNEKLRALCFGVEGEDYDMVNGKPQMREGKEETTIAHLKESGKVDELLNNMYLSTFLTPSDTLTNYLVYGVENAHFVAGSPVTMLEKRIAVKIESGTVTAFDVCGNPVTLTPTTNAKVFTYDENGTVYTVEVSNGNKYTGAGKQEHDGIPYYLLKQNGKTVKFKQRTIADLSGEDSLVKSITKDLTIGDLMGEGGDSKLMQTISAWKVDDLKDKTKIETLKIGEVIEIDTSETSTDSKLIQKLSTWSISDLSKQEKINEIRLDEIMNINEDSPHILREIATSTIGGLPDRLHSLKVTDVLADDEKNNRFTKHLQNVTVEHLSSELLKLSVQQVYVDQIFENKTVGTGEEAKRFYNGSVNGVALGSDNWLSEDNMHYYTYKSNASLDSDDRFKYYTKPVEEIIAEAGVTAETFDVNAAYAKQYEFTPILQGTWKYLLKDDSGATDKICYLSDIQDLVHNMTVNIQSTSLSVLDEDFEMEMTESFLQTGLTAAAKTAAGISSTKQFLGDLTIKELTQYVEVVFNDPTLLIPIP